MRHLLLAIALCSAGSLPARAADSPAQVVVGERSIEALLRIPGKLEPGRYEVEFQIDEYGAMKDFRLTSDTAMPEGWVARVRAAAQDFKFIPGEHAGKPVPMLYLEPLTWSR